MFFAYRTKQRLRIAFAVCIAYALLAAAAAAMLPRAGLGFLESFGWWLCAIPIGLAAYVALELFGTWSLDRPFWNRMSSWVRVLLLVTLVSCFAVGAVIVSQFIRQPWLALTGHCSRPAPALLAGRLNSNVSQT